MSDEEEFYSCEEGSESGESHTIQEAKEQINPDSRKSKAFTEEKAGSGKGCKRKRESTRNDLLEFRKKVKLVEDFTDGLVDVASDTISKAPYETVPMHIVDKLCIRMLTNCAKKICDKRDQIIDDFESTEEEPTKD